MKIKDHRNPFKSKLSEQLIEKEFSSDLANQAFPFEVSNNHCENDEGFDQDQDSPLSFLIKYKASYTKDPSSVKHGLFAFILPEDDYAFRKEPGHPSHFKSVDENHHNLILNTPQEVQSVTSKIHQKWDEVTITYDNLVIDEYLIQNYQRQDWSDFLKLADRNNWNKRIKQALVRQFSRRFGPIDVPYLGLVKSTAQAEVTEAIKKLLEQEAVTDIKMQNAIKHHFPELAL